MADRLTVLVGKGLGPWCPVGHLPKPKLVVRGEREVNSQLFVEYSDVPKYDGTPGDTVECGENEMLLKPAKWLRVGYLGTNRVICMVQGV